MNTLDIEELRRVARKLHDVDVKSDREVNMLAKQLVDQAGTEDILDFIYYPKPGDPKDPTVDQIVDKAIELRNLRATVFAGSSEKEKAAKRQPRP